MAGMLNDKKLLFGCTGIVKRIDHIGMDKVIFGTVNKENRNLCLSDLVQGRSFGKAVSGADR